MSEMKKSRSVTGLFEAFPKNALENKKANRVTGIHRVVEAQQFTCMEVAPPV